MSLFSTAPQLWDQPAAAAAAMEQCSPAADGTRGLGRLGSSYLDTDCILDGCPSRDTFLLPDDVDDAPMQGQHNLSTPSTQQLFPPFPHSQASPAGQAPCRTPAQPMHKTAGGHVLGGNPVLTSVLQDGAAQHSSAAWDKASTGTIPGFSTSMGLSTGSLGLVSSSGMTAGHSPLVSAHTAAALMAVDDDLQHGSLADMLGLDSSALLPLEGSMGNGLSCTEGSCSDLLWGPAGVLSEPPPAATGPHNTSGAGVGVGGMFFPPPQQQQQRLHSPQQQMLQPPAHRQPRTLPDASATLGAARALVGAVYQSPPRQGQQQQGTAGGAHQLQLRASPQKGRHAGHQQQQQLWTGPRSGAWLQQQAYHGAQLQQQQQQQAGNQVLQHSTNSSSARPLARVLNPHPADPRSHLQQLPAGTHCTQQQQQQQQQQQFMLPHEQQHRPQALGCMTVQQHMQAHQQGPPPDPAAAAAELHTWGSNASSVTVAADLAAGQDAAAAAGGQWTASPVNTAAAAGNMHNVAALHYPHMSRAGSESSDKATHSSSWPGGLSVQACGPMAAAAAAAANEPAGVSAAMPQQQQQQSSVALLQELLALQQQDSGSAAGSPGGATGSPAAPAARDAAGLWAMCCASGGAAAAGGAVTAVAAAAAAAAAANSNVEPAAPAGALASAALPAVPPGHPNSGAAAAAAASITAAAAAPTAGAGVAPSGSATCAAAGALSLNSVNSGSVGDSSHDSSQTQQQDAGSAEPQADAAAAAAGAAGVDAAGVPQPRVFHHKGGGPCDHCGVMESPQWRRGPPAKPILCNACGTRYRRTHHLGPPIPSTGRVGGPRPPAAGSSGRGSNGSGCGSTPGRKRVAAAEALGPAPLPVNLEGGVHTGTRLARNPHIRPSLKHYRSEDYEM